MKRILLGLVALCMLACQSKVALEPIKPGEIWPDNQGVHINAHGGGVLFHEGTYYWFGENKCDTTCNAMVGVMCYTSKNLTNWENKGVALSVVDDENSDIVRGCILERPKVIYNEKTGKFVMWFHLELKGQGYKAARTGVAVSDSPTGPYQFIRSERVNAGCVPFDMTEEENKLMATLDVADYAEWWTEDWEKAVE